MDRTIVRHFIATNDPAVESPKQTFRPEKAPPARRSPQLPNGLARLTQIVRVSIDGVLEASTGSIPLSASR